MATKRNLHTTSLGSDMDTIVFEGTLKALIYKEEHGIWVTCRLRHETSLPAFTRVDEASV